MPDPSLQGFFPSFPTFSLHRRSFSQRFGGFPAPLPSSRHLGLGFLCLSASLLFVPLHLFPPPPSFKQIVTGNDVVTFYPSHTRIIRIQGLVQRIPPYFRHCICWNSNHQYLFITIILRHLQCRNLVGIISIIVFRIAVPVHLHEENDSGIDQSFFVCLGTGGLRLCTAAASYKL